MSWQSLRNNLKTLIETINDISEVSSLPKLNFSGYPAVSITQVNLDNLQSSFDLNERLYQYKVRVFYDSASIGVNQAVDNIEDTVENIINKIDDEEKLGITRTIGDSLDDFQSIIGIESVVNEWTFVPGSSIIVQEIDVNIRVVYDYELQSFTNGDFENDLTNWIEIDPDNQLDVTTIENHTEGGSKSIRLIGDGSGGEQNAFIQQDDLNIAVDDLTEAYLFVYTDYARVGFKLVIEYSDLTRTEVETYNEEAGWTTSAWNKHSFLDQLTSGKTIKSITLGANTEWGIAGDDEWDSDWSVYYDDIVLSTTPIANPSVDGTVTGAINTTLEHTTTSDTDILIVCAGIHQGDITDVAFDGDSLTKAVGAASQFNERGEIWYLLNPAVKTADITMTISGGSGPSLIGVNVKNAKTSNWTPTTANADGNSSSPSINITPNVDNVLIIDSVYSEGGISGAGAGQMLLKSLQGQSYENAGASSEEEDSQAQTTMDWSLDSGQRWAISAIVIEPS